MYVSQSAGMLTLIAVKLITSNGMLLTSFSCADLGWSTRNVASFRDQVLRADPDEVLISDA